MKRIALAILIALMSVSGYAQLMNKSTKKVVVIKHTEAPKPATVNFSGDMGQANVVYGRIEENGDTTWVYPE